MANAYATMANGGIHMTPKLYTKVVDQNGKDVLVQDTTAKRVMKDSTAYMLTDVLKGVVAPGGTASGYVKAGAMPIAGKTGNTNDDKDQWFVGYTPYYTIAAWNGYDSRRAIGARKIGSYPYTSVSLFNTVVNSITKGQAVKQFEKPNSIVTASVCRVSGLVPTDACRRDPRGDQTITDIFAAGTVPTATCNIHKIVKICSVTGLLANENDAHPVVEKSFITRDYVPNIKPRDWQYMLPTQTCNETKKEEKPVEEEKPGNGVGIYDKTNNSNKNNSGSNNTTKKP
ncbi:Penicillin-binding protein 1A/1B [compost metagenome]